MRRFRLSKWQARLGVVVIGGLLAFGSYYFRSDRHAKPAYANDSILKPADADTDSNSNASANAPTPQGPYVRSDAAFSADQSPLVKTQSENAAAASTVPNAAANSVPNAASNTVSKVFYHNKVAVITYHHLNPVESSVTITPEKFKSHLEALKSSGFHVISMEDFVDFLDKKKSVAPNAVVITFDDGYESVHRYAYPILKSEGMTATTFLIVGYVEDGTVRQPPILTWNEIMEMHNDGFSFYSHSYHSHEAVVTKGKESSQLTTKLFNKSLNRLETDSEYKLRVSNDLTKADDILHDKIGNKLNLLCLPHGHYNQTVIDVASQAHIPFLFTGLEGLNTDNTKLIKRINAGSPYMSDKLLIKKLSQS